MIWIAAALSLPVLFVGCMHVAAFFLDMPERLTRICRHIECILMEPWHCVSRIWMHARGIWREVAGQ